MKRDPDKELRQIEKKLAKSSVSIPLPLKLRMASLILSLAQRRKKFGLFVILGWNDHRWEKYADTPDASQDIFKRHNINIMRTANQVTKISAHAAQKRRDDIVHTINFDGAILIDARGNVLHSGAMIEGLRPRATAHKLNPHKSPDLSTQFGFRHKVHMRHIAAITSSYLFRGTTIFTVSEETNDLHIFEGGKIIYSTVRGEPLPVRGRTRAGVPVRNNIRAI
jgi:hypothetical protein